MHKDNILNVNQQSPQKQARFLAAWKQGVVYLGADLFGPGDPQTARDKDQLQPLPEAVEVVFARESLGEEQFLAAMVSFYDPAWGEDLASRIDDYKCVAGLTYNLDHECIEILCELLRNYEGW